MHRRPWIIGLLVLGAGALSTAAWAQSWRPADEPPRLNLLGFSDINGIVNEDGKPNTFALGQFDLFMVSQLSDAVSVLAELVLNFSADGETDIDLHRIQLRYSRSDLLNVVVGRMHTPLGYWNQNFHHGTWFQTTATRPLLYTFEYKGGVLPIHAVGIEVSGTLAAPPLDIEYRAGVFNGRGAITRFVPDVQDPNDNKAVNVLVSLSPRFLPGLRAGADVYLDRIPPLASAGRTLELRERILVGHLVYVTRSAELLLEGAELRHQEPAGGREFRTRGFYAQGSYKVSRWRPYYRYDWLRVAAGDPFLPPHDLSRHTLGLRWDPLPWTALKAEYHFVRKAEGDVHSAQIQAAFTF